MDEDQREGTPRSTALAPPPEPESQERPAEPDQSMAPFDRVDIASMDSFPCSDPPGYSPIHS